MQLGKKIKVQALVPAFISTEMHVKGDIIGDCALDISGRVDGNIKCLSVMVKSGAIINGNITADKIDINGEVNGNIMARKINCGAAAKVVGDIIHKSIHIENGAYIDGSCRKFVDEAEEITEVEVAEMEEMPVSSEVLEFRGKALKELKKEAVTELVEA
ncbi:MAG: hypothetical protein COV36_06170 [Alphaproteobacteria bacterium CG11_big_fil_rev_8_21_14_0_20_44_7]|nr:MAG: hypothetical protein COV36_06170 [Alphaproteobacteria bacterium CG11_big_fil_rev_8_21_14_0_20_44_7]